MSAAIKTKSIESWLNDLPKKHRKKALFNMNKLVKDVQKESITDAIFGAFDFNKTAEGANYWNDVIYSYFK